MAQELGQAKVHVDVANDRVKASETQAQLLLQEQEQRLALLISELRKALKAITSPTRVCPQRWRCRSARSS